VWLLSGKKRKQDQVVASSETDSENEEQKQRRVAKFEADQLRAVVTDSKTKLELLTKRLAVQAASLGKLAGVYSDLQSEVREGFHREDIALQEAISLKVFFFLNTVVCPFCVFDLFTTL